MVLFEWAEPEWQRAMSSRSIEHCSRSTQWHAAKKQKCVHFSNGMLVSLLDGLCHSRTQKTTQCIQTQRPHVVSSSVLSLFSIYRRQKKTISTACSLELCIFVFFFIYLSSFFSFLQCCDDFTFVWLNTNTVALLGITFSYWMNNNIDEIIFLFYRNFISRIFFMYSKVILLPDRISHVFI